MSNEEKNKPLVALEPNQGEEGGDVGPVDQGKKGGKAKTLTQDLRITQVQKDRLLFQAEQNGVLFSVQARTTLDSGLDVEDQKIYNRISLQNALRVSQKLTRRTTEIQQAIAALERKNEENPSDEMAAIIILLKSAVS
jgi:hypothetical protein